MLGQYQPAIFLRIDMEVSEEFDLAEDLYCRLEYLIQFMKDTYGVQSFTFPDGEEWVAKQ